MSCLLSGRLDLQALARLSCVPAKAHGDASHVWSLVVSMAADVCVLRSYISAGLLARCAQVSPWWDEPTAEQEEQEVRLLFSAAVEAKTALELSWFCADCG